MPRQGKIFRQGLIEDLESRLNLSAEALKLAIDLKEKLDTDRNNRRSRAQALEAAAAAKNAYASLDEPIQEILGQHQLLGVGAANKYFETFGRYFISSVIGGTAAKILYDLVGPLSNADSRMQSMVADERELIAEIDCRRLNRYYYHVRLAAIKLSSFEKFGSIVKTLEYVRNKYPIPVLPNVGR